MKRPETQVSRRHRLYVDTPLSAGATVALPEAVAHHAARVLRLEDGDSAILFDGSGGEYPARLQLQPRGQVLAVLGEHQPVERELPFSVALLQGISAADKMDFTIQKAVELGVSSIQPLLTERSVVRLDQARQAKRVQHWQRVAVSACEQCGRNRVPPVAPPSGVDRYLPPEGALKLLLSPGGESRLPRLAAGATVLLAVGPEAGFSPDEERMLVRRGFNPTGLGPRILRTETAALAALAALSALAGAL